MDNRIAPEEWQQTDPNQVSATPESAENKTSSENLSYPLKDERQTTDVIFAFILIAFLIVLLVLLGYCMTRGDINRIVYGYDDCANVCGHINSQDPVVGCKGGDFRQLKYLLVQGSGRNVHRSCINDCRTYPGYEVLINRCVPFKTNSEKVNSYFSKTGIREFFQEVSEDLSMCWKEFIYLCLIALLLSLIIIFMFKLLVKFIVWVVLIAVTAASIVGTVFLWLQYGSEKRHNLDELSKDRNSANLAYAIIGTIFTIIVCLVIFVMRKRIKLVIQLFEEAGKAITNMPLLLLEPILTFISLAIVIALWFYFALWVESSGILTNENNQSAVKYVKDGTMKVTRWYNLLALFWFSQFIVGCQHMVIAGAVITWFFSRNKSQLESPIYRSFFILVRYHLGTVAFGSFLIAVVQMIRVCLKVIENALSEPKNRITETLVWCCQWCFACFDNFLRYLSRNAYIETAMFGTPFCEAGRKAFIILSNNAMRVFAINSVGDFVLFLGKAFVVLFTVLIGMELIQKKDGVNHNWVLLCLAGLFAYLISHCFITVYEMTIDTIFICFCEDCELNDGITKPYFMSRGLMEFVQNSKDVLAIKDKQTTNAWSHNGSPRQMKTISNWDN